MQIRSVIAADRTEWLRMRCALWPDGAEDHAVEIDRYLANPPSLQIVFVAAMKSGGLRGFLEAGTRPYAEGCRTSPVGYIEGWWVDLEFRRRGVGTALIEAAENWARSQGLTEMASDTDLRNQVSARAHSALGYEEVQRIICFRKNL